MTGPTMSLVPPWLAEDAPAADRLGLTRRMAGLIRGWEAAGDRRAIFLSCYAMMTRNMLTALDSAGFHDPAWVRDLLERFADYYFRALELAERGDPATPAAWRLVFEAAAAGRGHVLQHLLLGVNAHINYDLVLCLDDVLAAEWPALSPAARQARYEDHCHVNDVIIRTIDAVQDQVVERYAPMMEVVDAAFGPLDEWLIGRTIAHWRDDVWQHALERLAQPEAGREAVRIRVEDDSVARGHLIRLERVGASLVKLLWPFGAQETP